MGTKLPKKCIDSIISLGINYFKYVLLFYVYKSIMRTCLVLGVKIVLRFSWAPTLGVAYSQLHCYNYSKNVS